jgi:hypothetical protein
LQEESKVLLKVRDQLKDYGISADPRDYNLDVAVDEFEINAKLPFYSSNALGL